MGRLEQIGDAAFSGMTGGISSGISSAISGLFGKSQSEVNKQVFEQNKQLAMMQNAFNVGQWQRENAYNHPLQQRRRLEEAGINPDLAFSKGLENSSAPSPEMSGGTPMETYSPSENRALASQSASSMLSAMSQNRLNDANSKYRENEIKFQLQDKLLDLRKRQAETKNTELRNEYQRIINSTEEELRRLEIDSKSKDVDNKQLNNDMLSEKVLQEQFNTIEKSLRTLEVPKYIRMELESMYWNIEHLQSQCKLSSEQVRKLAQDYNIDLGRSILGGDAAALYNWLENALGSKAAVYAAIQSAGGVTELLGSLLSGKSVGKLIDGFKKIMK